MSKSQTKEVIRMLEEIRGAEEHDLTYIHILNSNDEFKHTEDDIEGIQLYTGRNSEPTQYIPKDPDDDLEMTLMKMSRLFYGQGPQYTVYPYKILYKIEDIRQEGKEHYTGLKG